MADKLEIRSGAYYKTRDGRKAFVAAMMPGNPFTEVAPAYPFMGYVDICGASWTAEGVYHIGHESSEFDLIAEWHDPITQTEWLAMWKAETNVCMSTFPSPQDAKQTLTECGYKLLALREITLTEGEGLDA